MTMKQKVNVFLSKGEIKKILKTMKVTICLLLMSLTLTLANEATYSQKTRLNVNLRDATLKDLINEIESQSEFIFIYSEDFVDLNRKVNINVKNQTVDKILDKVFEATDNSYLIIDRQIVITRKTTKVRKEKEISLLNIIIQEINIKGKVVDSKGNPLIGVNVIVKGTLIGTATDVNGEYSIQVPSKDAILVFKYLGYKDVEVNVGSNNFINVTMFEETTEMDEIVVVGYGTQRKIDVTGSVSTVPRERLSQIPVSNVMYAVQGAVAGVNITQTSSVPGRNPTTIIRGINSINASRDPLIILDGIPFEGNLNDININDIESIDILKDASAVAIYGTRGSNGVILITTKKGKTDKPIINYNGYMGLEGMANVLEPMNPEEYKEKYRYYCLQKGEPYTNPVPNLYEQINLEKGRTTDWLDVATQTGLIQDHNLSLNGGSEYIKYYVSGEYFRQKGVVKGYQFQRASLRSNIEANINKYLSLGTFIFYSHTNDDGGRVNFLNACAMSPYAYPYNDLGQYEIYPMYPELMFKNPLIGLTTERISRANAFNINGYGEIKPTFISGLKYRLNAAYTYRPYRYNYYEGRSVDNKSGSADFTNSETRRWVIENILSYSKDINKHHFDLTALYSAQKDNWIETKGHGVGFINDLLAYYNMDGATTQTVETEATSYTMLSQMLRLNYSFDSKYLFTFTVRRDGYSAFGANTDKYGTFPSVAFGWNINKENFLKDIAAINYLKLRTSYGITGNYAVGVNQTVTTASTVKFPFNGTAYIGVLADNLGNANLHWETTKGFNIGLDFSFIENRIKGTIEYYNTQTEGILMRRNLPRITGYSYVWDNIGKMGNKGIELSLNTTNIKYNNFVWETNIVFSKNKNKIIDLYGDKKDDIGNRWFIGQPLFVIYDYEMVGVWQEGEDPSGWDPGAKPGDLKFKDQPTIDSDGDGIPDKGDGKIDGNDRKILGSTLPKWTGGLTTVFSYKNLVRLSIFIQTVQGSLKNNVDYSYADEMGRRNIPREIGYWTAENKRNDRPSLAYTNPRGYGYPMDNSFTRIKDITLSINLPKNLLNDLNIDNFTIYFSGRNLYTFTKWVGWDPENNYSPRGSGDWTNNYPPIRSFIVGINLSLK